MNCKPGDLAIIIASSAGNEGKIVRCVRLIKAKDYWYKPSGQRYEDATWEIDRLLPDYAGQLGRTIGDSQLRPIRDPGDDATDETLLWLPVPSRETEAA